MKKFIYIIAMISLPAFAVCQYVEATYSTDLKTSPSVVQISPNPGNGQFHVLFARNHDIYTSMIAYDNAGKVVYEKEHLNGNPVQVDMSQLQAGIYFVVFMADNRMERLTERVIIAK